MDTKPRSRLARAAAAALAAGLLTAATPALAADQPGSPDLMITSLDGDNPWRPISATPGVAFAPVAKFTNKGSAAAPQVVVEAFIAAGLDFAQRYANCEYATEGGGYPGTLALCTVDSPIEPGGSAALDGLTLVPATTATSTGGKVTIGSAESATAGEWRRTHHFERGTGPRLTVGRPEGAPATTQVGNGGYYPREFSVAVDNSADYAASAEWTPAADGRRGRVTVGLRNDGPGIVVPDLDRYPSGFLGAVSLTLPQGVEVTKLPDNCGPFLDTGLQPVPHRYHCAVPWKTRLGVGATKNYDIEVALSSGFTRASAAVSLEDDYHDGEHQHPDLMWWDKNPGNDRITLLLGDQAATTTPTPGPRPTATASPTGTVAPTTGTTPTRSTTPTRPAAPTTPAAATAPAPTTSSAASVAPTTPVQGLASTGGGSGMGTTAALGGGALALGGLLAVWAARRRRGAHR
ncbi:hypothetical protein CFP65_3194 [Kitasatospora sp. MMS16-BH015]|uniref:hypothetical protein n=1 Tax=Kitasatospora sp. MMS16-BH015 TaxID=2018025 RepID=UPI000CA33092|nr:hypothetical protein [Kitasatospora sp. MMS16-BH015]AUG77998.1 hypothetical protein CFP65_3194 [Kitasatospora sp. MMS16-BH015]